MFPDVDPAEHTAGSLRAAYGRALRESIDGTDPTAIADATGLDPDTVRAVVSGDQPQITLPEAAAIRSTVDGRDAEILVADARDEVLLAMSSAVLDVETLTHRLDGELSAKELQQKIEGRHPMTLTEYAQVRVVLAEDA
ncbi:MAG: DUF5791 family protein [Halorhabdus sp.]